MVSWKTLFVMIPLVGTLASPAWANTPVLAATIAQADHQQDGTSSDEIQKVTDWVLSFMISVAPPGRKIYYPEGQETEEEALTRYRSIAADLVRVVYDPNVKPLFTGPNGRSRTLAVMLSVMFHESSFMRHVDYGLGKYARGDSGKSVCMMQLYVGAGRTMRWNVVHDRPVKWNDPVSEIRDGYTGDEILQDRKLCFREGIKVLQLSFGGTRGMSLDDRLRIYASGSPDKGALASRNRMRLAMSWFAKSFHGQFTDEEVMLSLPKEKTRPLDSQNIM